jgi:hypothetical protein
LIINLRPEILSYPRCLLLEFELKYHWWDYRKHNVDSFLKGINQECLKKNIYYRIIP